MVADLQHVQRDFQACPVILAVVISKIFFFLPLPQRAVLAEQREPSRVRLQEMADLCFSPQDGQ